MRFVWRFEGDRLQDKLATLGITEPAFAKKINVSLDVVQDWIAGSCQPSLAEYLSICEALGIRPNSFYTGEQKIDITYVGPL